jgi:hypothetical protein
MPEIRKMTPAEVQRMNGQRKDWMSERSSGWKAWIGGEWLYGFLTREQAEAAVRKGGT